VKHREYLMADNRIDQKRKDRLKSEVHNIIINRLYKWARARLTEELEAKENLDDLYEKKTDPYTAAAGILKELGLS
jgi:putative protein kinase ArgK-like GTPase of G3E family